MTLPISRIDVAPNSSIASMTTGFNFFLRKLGGEKFLQYINLVHFGFNEVITIGLTQLFQRIFPLLNLAGYYL